MRFNQSTVDQIRKNEAPLLRVQADRLGASYKTLSTPTATHTYYFNPSLMEWNGKRYLVARKFWMDYEHWWDYRSKVSIMELYEGDRLGPEKIMQYPLRALNESVEDPRVSMFGGRPAVAACAWMVPTKDIKDHSKIVIHQSLFRLGDDFNSTEILDVPYGGNSTRIDEGFSAEKNWLWFDHEGLHYMIYQAEPHTVCRVVNDGFWKVTEEYRTHNPSWWTLGTIRGGTPPVRHGDFYYTFYHSSMPWKRVPHYGVRRVYYMGAYKFEAKPPFRIVAATQRPLFKGTWNEPMQPGVPAVVYPNGALRDSAGWLISVGVNDCGCGLIRLPDTSLEPLLQPA